MNLDMDGIFNLESLILSNCTGSLQNKLSSKDGFSILFIFRTSSYTETSYNGEEGFDYVI